MTITDEKGLPVLVAPQPEPREREAVIYDDKGLPIAWIKPPRAFPNPP